MKTIKFAFTLLLLFVAVFGSAQERRLYSKIRKKDKFDDVVWEKQVKTLILKTDTSFIIETKGQKPVEYRYLDYWGWAVHLGSEDSLINIAKDVYGYESQYYVFNQEDINEAYDEFLETTKDLEDSLLYDENFKKASAILKLVTKRNKLPIVVYRTISKYKYIYEYDTDLFWIKFPDGSRVIYSNQ